MSKSTQKARLWIVSGIIALAIIYCYWDVRTYDFVNYDDTEYLTQNPNVMRPLSLTTMGWAFTTLYMANWHPLTWMSYLIDYTVYGGTPTGYHATNVLFHILNSILIFLMLYRMTDRFWLAGVVGLLFAIHPMHVESVAWISERKDVLSTLFLVLTMFAYYEYGRRRIAVWYVIALCMFALGLMSKPMLVTAPFVLLLLDYWPLDRLSLKSDAWFSYITAYFSKRNIALWVEKIPFFLLSAGASYVTIIAQHEAGAISTTSKISLFDRMLNAIQSYGLYIYKTVVPFDLAVYYPYPKTIALLQIGGVAIFLLAVTYLALRNARKKPYVITGWLIFIGTLVPVIGLLQVGSQAMADRYVYIPHIGLFIAIVFLIGSGAERLKKAVPILALAMVFVIGALMALTVRQVQTWQNSETLYLHAISVTPPNRTAHHNLSAHYIDLGQYSKALRHAKTAVKINPSSASSHHNIGLAFEKLGLFDSARVYYEQTLHLDSTHSETYGRLGTAYFALGMYDDAQTYYRKALDAQPNSAINNNNLGAFYLKVGMPERSAEYFTRAIELDPYFNLPYDNLAMFMLNIGKYEEAEKFLDRSLELNPANPVANKYKGDMFVLREKHDSALVYFARSLARQPMNRELHSRIYSILEREDIDSLSALHNLDGELNLHTKSEAGLGR